MIEENVKKGSSPVKMSYVNQNKKVRSIPKYSIFLKHARLGTSYSDKAAEILIKT